MATQTSPFELELPTMSGKKPSKPRAPSPLELTLPETEFKLTCANKRRLFHSFRMANESRWVADWLLTHPTHPFHHHTSIPTDAFDNALAIRATHRLVSPETCGASSSASAPAAGPISPGHDLLLVPVAHSSGRLIGYSFGGLEAAQNGTMSCTYDARTTPFFPHFVGRFAFDGSTNDLLIVANRVNDLATGIISIKRGDGRVRERSNYGVQNGSYGYKMLPARIAQMTATSERRLASIPKYQFSSSSGSGGGGENGRRRGEVKTDNATLRADLAKLERLVKGKFFSPKMTRDQMDVNSGELTVRETAQVEASFDVKDAVGMQVFRDTAGRAYYSYMSAVSAQRAAAGSAGKAPM